MTCSSASLSYVAFPALNPYYPFLNFHSYRRVTPGNTTLYLYYPLRM
jgi:hypothetical protein